VIAALCLLFAASLIHLLLYFAVLLVLVGCYFISVY